MDAKMPQPPPEALLLKEALRRARMSGREAARRAEISDAWWRAVTNGFQNVGGVRVPVIAPDDTLARMAHAVGVTPDELREVNRTEAADLLTELRAAPSPASLSAGSASTAQIDAIATLLATLPPEAQAEVLRRVGLTEPATEVTDTRRRRAG